ncbi:hypothetical protein CC80DRAFT_466036 [Byssothecium circinans]|uniref:Protein kinase domain-containing protein n=1 Tax=Byssothecium circinans TaxID=147558 RepID=A0A6A5U607_9PLEO|nr:hypothetical protein CC80DRAFT_466036 [Byssothecium circinans]
MQTRNGFSEFLPKSQLYRLINQENVKRELEQQSFSKSPSQIENYTDIICRQQLVVLPDGREKLRSFRKIFGLLVLAERVESISNFLDNNVSDLDLPLIDVQTKGWPDLRRNDSFGKATGGPLSVFKNPSWSPMQLYNFKNQQWQFLAPFFSQNRGHKANHYVLQDQHILPFTPLDDTRDDDEYYGGFAKVITVKIHSDHHDFRDEKLCAKGFAIKELITMDRRTFEKEVKILATFSGESDHAHIVSLLATYEQFNKFHLIFHKAEGDLFRYWKEINRSPEFSHRSVDWMVRQCAGIAEGLGKLHLHSTRTQHHSHANGTVLHVDHEKHVQVIPPMCREARSDSVQSNGARIVPISPTFAQSESDCWPESAARVQEEKYGRHGDISPGNILFYENNDDSGSTFDGVLKLSDFGEAELNSRFSRTKKENVATTLTYRPPECDFPPRHIRQSCDIWCLGCVFLEFTAWLIGGAELLEFFGRQRLSRDPFSQEKTDIFFNAEEIPITRDLVPVLKASVTQFIERLHRDLRCSELIHEFLNFIQYDMLVVDESQRASCDKVSSTLKSILRRGKLDKEYAVKALPWHADTKLRRRDRRATKKWDIAQLLSLSLSLNLGISRSSSSRQKYYEQLDSFRGLLSFPVVHKSGQLFPRAGSQGCTYVHVRTRMSAPASPTNQKCPCNNLRMTLLNAAASQIYRYHASWTSAASMDGLDEILDNLTAEPLSLANQILHSFSHGVSSFDDGPTHEYLANGLFDEMITVEGIRNEMIRCVEHGRILGGESDKLCKWIFENARKVLAITEHCGLDEDLKLIAMAVFQRHDFCDDRLPIEEPSPTATVWEHFPGTVWGPMKLSLFYNFQFKFTVPVFTLRQYKYDLKPRDIFPFTIEPTLSKIGGFSSVHKVRIHKDHQEDQRMLQVAIKEIKVGSGNDQTDEAWNREAKALNDINELHHPHIIKCIAAIRRGNGRYFMFPWADGDNLREYWSKESRQNPEPDIVLHALQQLHGIADALHTLHTFCTRQTPPQSSNYDEPQLEQLRLNGPVVRVQDEVYTPSDDAPQESIRHGDLKPDNILVFSDPESRHGVFRIADLGLAKKHIVKTSLRDHHTSTIFGTRRYEPPEAGGVQSRLFDIWSMGCITLEYIIWLLYGNDELQDFNEAIDMQQSQYFERSRTDDSARDAEVNPIVRSCIEHIKSKDPECSQESAIRDLLEIVQTRLLIVPLPPDRVSSTKRGRLLAPPALGESVTRYRATAAEFRDALKRILDKVSTPGYLLTGKDRTNIIRPARLPAPLPSRVAQRNGAPRHLEVNNPQPQSLTGILGRNYRVSSLFLNFLKGWEFPVDNQFATSVVERLTPSHAWPHTPSELCARCSNLDFLAGGFAFEDKVSTLESQGQICDLCRLLHQACRSMQASASGRVRFERNQSKVTMSDNSLPVLSIYRSPDAEFPLPIQIGLPELTRPGSEAFFTVLKLWLQDCNTSHADCQVVAHKKFPTRLIEVGTSQAPKLRLLETSEEDISGQQYIALSHPWGDTTRFPPFNTLRKDDSGAGHDIESFKREIPFSQLPMTFQHAVICTRALDIRYLWIDSICIIQGKDGDFSEEANRMEDVYSGAYCVFAASRARHQHDGFLKDRPRANYVTLRGAGGKPYYLCQAMDNFSQDVLEGSLNKRGWVLQERVLARRTIFFAETQTYFECGSGVRCETLARMRNNMADFLGDPNFPVKAMRTNSRALKISYFQDLYQKYSRLNFTRDDDRPFAIAGIEKRLQVAYNTKGGYGIFDDGPDGGLFHRSLLWKRGEDNNNKTTMRLIDFPAERNIRVPSWSWMAYSGGIEYTDPPFQAAEWEKDDISPPWTRDQEGASSSLSAPLHLDMALNAIVRDFTVAGRSKDEANLKLTYDMERTASNGTRTQCVVVARSRDERSYRDKTHYVLLVAQQRSGTVREEKVYRRVGAGVMPGKFITLDKPGTAARIL